MLSYEWFTLLYLVIRNRTKDCNVSFFLTIISQQHCVEIHEKVTCRLKQHRKIQSTQRHLVSAPCLRLADVTSLPPLSCYSATLPQRVCQVCTTLSLLLCHPLSDSLLLSYFSATVGWPRSSVFPPNVKKTEIFSLFIILYMTCDTDTVDHA